MPNPNRIEAYAIITEDGMLADADRKMPGFLQVEADQNFFQGGLDDAAVIVHGRHSHEGGPRAGQRRRLVMTHKVATFALDPSRPQSMLWNPRGAALEEAWAALGAPRGMLAVIGGPHVYDFFLDVGYDAFHLTRVANVRLPGGRPVFSQIGPDRTPEDVLAAHGLEPGPAQMLDEAAGATLVTWRR